MIEARTAVDVEGAVVAWCKSLAFTAFFGTNNNGAFPQVVVQRIAGTDNDALIQFDVWAAPRRTDGSIPPDGSKKAAADEASRLATEITSLSSYSSGGARLHDATWLGTRWLPDPTSDRPRYIVEATFFATAV